MNVTTASLTSDTRVTTAAPSRRSLLRVGALAGVAAAVATELVAAVARVSDVSMEAGGFGADTAEPIPVSDECALGDRLISAGEAIRARADRREHDAGRT